MSIFDGVRQLLNNALKTPVAPIYINQVENVGRPPVYPAYNTQTYINAYITNATINTIVSYMAQKFGSIPRYACEIEDPQAAKAVKYILKSQKISYKKLREFEKKAYGEPIKPSASMITGTPEQRLARLTERPNSHQGQDAYYAEVYMFYLLTGNTFVELNRGDITDDQGKQLDDKTILALPVLEKIVRHTQCIQIIPSKQDINTVLGYRFEETSGNFRFIPAVNMIHYKNLNPCYDGSMGTHLLGLSPLAAGLKLLTQDNSATDAAVAMQQNQGAKGILINESIENPTPVQAQAMRDAVNTNINNTSNKGTVGVLGGSKYNYLDIGQTSVDLQLTQSQQAVFVMLCNLFGCPPEVFITGNTYENKEQAGKLLLTNKLLPAACSFRDEENRVIIPSFGLDPMQFTTDIDSTLMVELAEDTLGLAQQLNLSPFLTLNEKRIAMGNEPMDDPNFDKAYIQNTLISVDDINVNDGLDSYSGSGDSYQPGSGLPDNQNAQTGDAGNADNAITGRPKPRIAV